MAIPVINLWYPNMKLNDFSSHLVGLLDRPTSDFTELLRSLKEQSDHFDPEKYPDILQRAEDMGATELHKNMLKARPGPGGGLNADPFLSAFLLTALMINGPRKETARNTWRAWHMHVEGSVLSGFRRNDEEFVPEIKVCPLTLTTMFGEAFKTILAEADVAATVEKIRISDSHWAEIVYDGGAVSRFEGSAFARDGRHKMLSTIAELHGSAIHAISMWLQAK